MRNQIILTAAIVVFSLLQARTLADDNSTQFNISSVPSLLEKLNISTGVIDEFKKFIGAHGGEVIEGLSKVKIYLQHYGYIPNTAKNFTNTFDETLVAAIKSYQKFYNIEQTGQLDTKTIAQMILPRCGNRDVGDQTSSSSSSSRSSSHVNSVGHYEYFPDNPRWDKLALTFAFLPGNHLSENYKKTIVRAFSSWAAVTPLTFTRTESYNEADIKIAFYSGDHGDGGPFDGTLGQLAHAFEPPAGMFHFDSDENWEVEGELLKLPSRVVTAVDLESVAVHEIGHLLGLGHSTDKESVMYATLPTLARKVLLKRDDIAGIQSIYGANTKTAIPNSPPNDGGDVFSGTSIVVAPFCLPFFMVVVALVNNIFL
ncbi:hypothetical protein Ddye_031161 [Dipteronia dyeriana]|uniref:Peptidase metallopeptidase domain-containing protein n=1 Tax=Dipteronia dyeriana TaxID=168575 RepID=A0AAD9THS8_9ROSI|nr:hypothetical protein Ddye_031161 [Dipteronia dyeriana]